MTTKLNAQTVGSLSEAVPTPAYDRSKVSTGIVHIGVGGFHRAHEAVYVDRLMNAGEALDYGITGIGLLPHDDAMRDVLTSQDCLYTLVIKNPDGTLEPRVIGSIVGFLFAPDDPRAVLDLMADPATRIVSLTITEGGYLVDDVTGTFNPDDPSIASDLQPGSTPSTAVSYITEALRLRREAGVAPFTVMSCDNVPGNGEVAQQMICEFARLKDPDLADWIEREVSFPNSMVDRITPGTTDTDRSLLAERFGIDDGWPVVCESFSQWVLQDTFGNGRPPLEDAGVQLVDDVTPYELMKLRLLNASHQALGYLGYLAGHRYTNEACEDPLFPSFVRAYMDHEATPTLAAVPGVDLDHYKDQLIERFANPEVADTLARLCAESSDRIPKFLIPVVRAQLASGGEIERAALVVAAWARYAEGTDEAGQPIEVVDQRREQLMARAQQQADEPLAFIDDRVLFGDLIDDERFVAAYRTALESLHSKGARATLEAYQGPDRMGSDASVSSHS